MTAPLFVFGVARSGTNLVARMLDAHPAIALALDPLMPLLRLWRNLALAGAAAETGRAFDPAAPFQDGYFAASGPWHLDAIREAPADLPIPPDAFGALGESTVARAGLESRELAEAFTAWGGGTIRERLESALAVIVTSARRQGKSAPAYAGSKEVWTIDFAQPLARALPGARFVVLHRDPRAVIASLVELGRRDPSQAAHAVSYLRHWRKHVAVSRLLEASEALAGRVLVLRFEDVAADPQGHAERLCAFLGLPFEAAMLEPGGAGWTGNSSFGPRAAAVDPAARERWRHHLDPALIRMCEAYCGPEMDLAGYPHEAPGFDGTVAAQALQAGQAPGTWRSDSGDTIADLAWEALRGRMLAEPDSGWPAEMVRRCFLFESVFEALRIARPRGA